MAVTFRDEHTEGVEFSREGDLVTAIDIETGIAASGESKGVALRRLSDALANDEGRGEPIEDEEAFLQELGIDPDEIEEEETSPPWL